MTKPRNEVIEPRAPLEATADSESHKRLDARLDEALKETFPASDPIAVTPLRGDADRSPTDASKAEAAKPPI